MSPLGASGGRSQHNKLGQGAEKRATPRQRDGVDHPDMLDPTRHDVGVEMVRGGLVTIWVVGCVLLAIWLATLFGILPG